MTSQPPYGQQAGQPPYRQPPGGQPPYGQPPYGQPPYGQPTYAPAPAPRPTSTTGPKITVVIGVAILVAAVVVGVLAARAVAGLVPTDVLRPDGSPGAGVLEVADVPGSAELVLTGDRTYFLYLVTRGQDSALTSAPDVRAPGGAQLDVDPGSTSSTLIFGGTRAELVAIIDAPVDGTYAVELPPALGGTAAQVWVAEGDSTADQVGGILGGVFGILGAVALGALALVLLVVGGIMWAVRHGGARGAPRA